MYTGLIAFFTLAIIVSFLCSLWEAVLLSISPSYVQVKFNQSSKFGNKLHQMKENIDRPLAAILTLNTIAHTVGAIGVGEQASRIWFETNPIITSYIVPIVMTLSILFLSEIIPKTMGANYWKELAPFTVFSLTVLMRLLGPLVWLCQLITKSMVRKKGRSGLSRTDFIAMTQIGHQEGIIQHKESEIINNLLAFNTIRAQDIMTPRIIVKFSYEELTLNEFYQENKNLRFSRVPLLKGPSNDEISGYFMKDELLTNIIQKKQDMPLREIKRDIMIVNESSPIPKLFNDFIEQHEHIALVIDKFGSMTGIVTVEDVIETLLGLEIVDEFDSEADMQVLARKIWTRRAKQLGIISESTMLPSDNNRKQES